MEIHERVKLLLKERKIKHIRAAEYLGISKQSMSRKLSGIREFTIKELGKLRILLNLTNDEFVKHFFSDT